MNEQAPAQQAENSDTKQKDESRAEPVMREEALPKQADISGKKQKDEPHAEPVPKWHWLQIVWNAIRGLNSMRLAICIHYAILFVAVLVVAVKDQFVLGRAFVVGLCMPILVLGAIDVAKTVAEAVVKRSRDVD